MQDGSRLYLVLEFCAGGDLGHYLRRYRQVSEATARYFLQQVAEGLKELRRHNVIHVRGGHTQPLQHDRQQQQSVAALAVGPVVAARIAAALSKFCC